MISAIHTWLASRAFHAGVGNNACSNTTDIAAGARTSELQPLWSNKVRPTAAQVRMRAMIAPLQWVSQALRPRAQGGEIMHSSSYNDASLAKGRRVVVLGGSKSATDIAVSAVKSGASEVTLVYRERFGASPISLAAWSTSNASSISVRRSRCFRAGAWARWRGLRTLSQSRWCGRIGAGWRGC